MSPPQKYSFVNVRPETKAEKRQTRTTTRSHIGRWTQEQQHEIEGTTTLAIERSSQPEPSQTVYPSPAASEQTQSQPGDQIETVRNEESSFESGVSHADRGCVDDEDDELFDFALIVPSHLSGEYASASIPASNSTVQVLGSCTIDPFRTYPSDFPSALVSQCHAYCKLAHSFDPRFPGSLLRRD